MHPRKEKKITWRKKQSLHGFYVNRKLSGKNYKSRKDTLSFIVVNFSAISIHVAVGGRIIAGCMSSAS
jgi:hypothetical protein